MNKFRVHGMARATAGFNIGGLADDRGERAAVHTGNQGKTAAGIEVFMQDLVMDAAEWQSVDDMYLSFFRAVGAPDWHGKNFDALRDSIAGGDINRIETPYRLVFANYRLVKSVVKRVSDDFIQLIHELATEEGVAVEIRVEN
jgi:RNAse (barnase) inhibitor barstar